MDHSDLREVFEERAAIAEFDGLCSRPEAEAIAKREIRRRFDGPLADVFLKSLAEEKARARSQQVRQYATHKKGG